jgi:hypothetical protein
MKERLRDRRNGLEAVKFLWAARFKLPPSDERLSRVTAREALEQVHGVAAIEQLAHEAQQARKPAAPAAHTKVPQLPPMSQPQPRFIGGKDLSDVLPQQAEMVTKRGPEAQAIADVPHLTGDPEWDALELAETDPSKPPLKIVG